MKILGIETTAKTASVAICEDFSLIAEFSLTTSTHSTVLLPMTESVLSKVGMTVDDIDLFAVSSGPGSFTGVRIGASTIKGLAFKNNTPCIGVSSLEALSMNFIGIDGLVVPVIDARRDTVYTALFRTDSKGTIKRCSDDMQITTEDLFERLRSELRERIYFTGDAYDSIILHDGCPEHSSTPERLRRQSAYGVAAAALFKWNCSEDTSVFTDANLAPVYLKKSQAERELEDRINNIKEKK